MDIQPISSDYFRVPEIRAGGASPRRERVSDVPENVFAPPGVLTRLTALLHASISTAQTRPDYVAKGSALASNPGYPSQRELSSVAEEILGAVKRS